MDLEINDLSEYRDPWDISLDTLELAHILTPKFWHITPTDNNCPQSEQGDNWGRKALKDTTTATYRVTGSLCSNKQQT